MEDEQLSWLVRISKSAFENISIDNFLNSGCDLPSHLYSFSFNLNPNWSKQLCEQPEILQCRSIAILRHRTQC
jgi:hypothetical protein